MMLRSPLLPRDTDLWGARGVAMIGPIGFVTGKRTRAKERAHGTPSGDAGGTRRLGLARGARRQRGAARAYADIRSALGGGPARVPQDFGSRRRSAGRPDGQLRGRTFEH